MRMACFNSNSKHAHVFYFRIVKKEKRKLEKIVHVWIPSGWLSSPSLLTTPILNLGQKSHLHVVYLIKLNSPYPDLIVVCALLSTEDSNNIVFIITLTSTDITQYYQTHFDWDFWIWYRKIHFTYLYTHSYHFVQKMVYRPMLSPASKTTLNLNFYILLAFSKTGICPGGCLINIAIFGR